MSLPVAEIVAEFMCERKILAARCNDILVIRYAPVPLLDTLGKHPVYARNAVGYDQPHRVLKSLFGDFESQLLNV